MATLKTRIDDTKTAVRDELDGWQSYVRERRAALGRELQALATPTGIQLAVLKTADQALTRAHAEVRARVEALEAAKRKVRRSPRAKTATKTPAKKPTIFLTPARAA